MLHLTIYNYFLTLDDEIKFIWPTPLNLGKALFFLVRYIPMPSGAFLIYVHTASSNTSFELCDILYQLSGMVILFRTCALLGHGHRFLKLSLWLLGLILLVPAIILMYLSIRPSTIISIINIWAIKILHAPGRYVLSHAIYFTFHFNLSYFGKPSNSSIKCQAVR
ncbi:hypothetical protein Clacol_000858 [Clathrus columnatus]|uniref:DUF6533 domain-containing protein n=1 Tax=Clathrus columnatus TaxID=1419009 RepID=A0AAV4ZZJ5_9AGAM|nr:hypothetical protein Clacol_000858 [Clathrus columnatus]